MRERIFIARRRPFWERLESLLNRVDRQGLRGLDVPEIQELGRLYRSATTDLATAQTRAYDPGTVTYLNRLVARSHAYVYVASARAGWSRVAQFFAVDFPSEVRRSFAEIGASAMLFILAAVVGYTAVSARPLNAYALLPAQEIPVVHKSLHDSNFNVDSALAPALSSALITNNVQVAALAFAGGMTLGILTLWVVLNNGLALGGLGALFAAKGFGLDFWATVAPHGALELSAIQIAAGAGLLLARAIIAPGQLRRVDALKANGRRAATLLVGVAAMLVVAGTIEGFFSPLRLGIAPRIAMGIATGTLLAIYLIAVPWPSRRGTRRSALA
jgi:uncharacterized membrane protein SpoIIM required for sporulation